MLVTFLLSNFTAFYLAPVLPLPSQLWPCAFVIPALYPLFTITPLPRHFYILFSPPFFTLLHMLLQSLSTHTWFFCTTFCTHFYWSCTLCSPKHLIQLETFFVLTLPSSIRIFRFTSFIVDGMEKVRAPPLSSHALHISLLYCCSSLHLHSATAYPLLLSPT